MQNLKLLNNEKKNTYTNKISMQTSKLFHVESKNPKLLTHLFSSLKSAFTEIQLSMIKGSELNNKKKEGLLKISGYSSCCGVYISIELKENEFSSFYCAEDEQVIVLNLQSIISFTKGMDKSQLMSMYVMDNSQYLDISCNTVTGDESARIILVEQKETRNIRKIEGDINISISAKWFKDKLSIFSQAITGSGSVEITVTKKQITLSCVTEIKNKRVINGYFHDRKDDNDNIICINTPNVDDNLIINQSYTLDNLMLLTKFKDLSATFDLLIKQSKVLTVVFTILDRSKIVLMIAPLKSKQ